MKQVDVSEFDPDGAGDASGSVFGLPYGPEESAVVLLPVPWEPTVSYGRGTAGGPQAIREASPQLDLYDPELAELGLARPWTFGVHMLAADPQVQRWNAEACRLAIPIVEAGGAEASDPGLVRVNALGRSLDARVEETTARWLAQDKIVGLVGGDHSTALGSIAAAAARHRPLGILHIDAHADLRVAYEGFERSHASVMHNVLAQVEGVERIVQVGIRDLSGAEARRIEAEARVRTFFDHEIRRRLDVGDSWAALCETIVEELPERVYVSFDIDGLDPALCPHTGTPVPGGLGFGQALSLLRAVATSGRRIVGFDLVEVAPAADGDGDWDGNVGARVLYRLCGAALYSAGARDPGPSD